MSNQNLGNVINSSSYLLSKLDIKYTLRYLSNLLQTHPFFPSLAAVSDVFSHYNVENEAFKVSYDTLHTLQVPFIAHLTVKKGTFVVVEKVTNDEVLFHLENKSLISLKKDDFIQIWDNVIFQAKTTSISGEPDYVKHHRKEQLEKAKIPAMLLLVTLIFLFFVAVKPALGYFIPLFMAKIIGLFFAILLIKKELGYQSDIADKLCTLSKSAGCNEVLHSKVSKLFGNVFLADVGLIWFLSSL